MLWTSGPDRATVKSRAKESRATGRGEEELRYFSKLLVRLCEYAISNGLRDKTHQARKKSNYGWGNRGPKPFQIAGGRFESKTRAATLLVKSGKKSKSKRRRDVSGRLDLANRSNNSLKRLAKLSRRRASTGLASTTTGTDLGRKIQQPGHTK